MSDTIQLTINGMTCQHCVAAVEKALPAVDGVEEVIQITLDPGSATVKGVASTEALIAAVKQAGYEASL
ncbi:MAG: CopZ family metallochaperone [Thiogranum sp.]